MRGTSLICACLRIQQGFACISGTTIPASLRYRLPLQPVAKDTLWQAFRFATPAVVVAFKDTSDCVQAYAEQGRLHTCSCE